MTSDSDLLRQFATDNSARAFAELVGRHVNLVYSSALRQVGGDSHFAEDVVQTVFVDLARKAGTVCERPTIQGWLYTSTHFAASKAVRAERRRKNREQEAHAMNETLFARSNDEDWNRLRPVLDQAMHELSDQEREVVLLRYFEKLPLAAIGDRLGVTENAATKSVQRALNNLQVRLSRRGITSTSAALAAALADQAIVAAPAGLTVAATEAALLGVQTAGAGATSVAGFISLMITGKNTTAAILAALAMLGIGISLYEYPRLNSPDDGASATVAKIDDATLKSRIDASMDRVRDLEAKLSEVTARAEAAAKARSEAVPADSAVTKNSPPNDARRKEFRYDYAPTLAKLNLTPEVEDQLVDIFDEYERRTFQAGTTGLALNETDLVVLSDMMEAANVDQADAIRNLVGDQAYQVIRQDRLGSPDVSARDYVYLLFGSALTDAQANRLVSLIGAAALKVRQTGAADSDPSLSPAEKAHARSAAANNLQGNRIDLSPAALAEAATFLTPEQQTKLETASRNFSRNVDATLAAVELRARALQKLSEGGLPAAVTKN